MSENTNNTNLNEMPIKLHVLNSTRDQQDMSLIQMPNPNYNPESEDPAVYNPYINMLIDGGYKESDNDHLELLRDIFNSQKAETNAPAIAGNTETPTDIMKIDYIYLTHFHNDHAGGLEKIDTLTILDETTGRNFKLDVNNAIIFLPENPPANFLKTSGDDDITKINDNINNTYALAKRCNMTIVIPGAEAGAVDIADGKYIIIENSKTAAFENKEVFNIGPNNMVELDFKNHSDTAKYYSAYPDDDTANNAHNNSSLCCIMTYGKTRIGFFGDISNKAQEHLYHNEEIGHLDLISVEHHGKNGGFYRPFYDAIAPKMCYTQDGRGKYGDDNKDILLASRTKSQVYLQENNIPNYAVSVNETMTFDIYKSGIATKEKAVRYANGIKGVTSYLGAVNNSNGSHSKFNTLHSLLKNMEHGTFLSTKITKEYIDDNEVKVYKLWSVLLENLVDSDLTNAQLILYKGGSSADNQSEKDLEYPDSGYIVIIPHTSNPLSGPIFSHWYANKEYTNINLKLKPLTHTEHFRFVKSSTGQSISQKIDNCNLFSVKALDVDDIKTLDPDQELSGFLIEPNYDCTVNFTIYFKNANNTKKTVKYYDGDELKTVSVPANSGITIPNCAILKEDIVQKKVITIPNVNNVYVKICGYATYSQTTPKEYKISKDTAITGFLEYNSYPLF